MKIKNEKGHVYLAGLVIAPAHAATLVSVVAAFKIAFAAIALACIWHIPAWEKAKANGTEAQYQAQKMWPQIQAEKYLPHGSYTYVPYTAYKPHGGELRAKLLAMQQ